MFSHRAHVPSRATDVRRDGQCATPVGRHRTNYVGDDSAEGTARNVVTSSALVVLHHFRDAAREWVPFCRINGAESRSIKILWHLKAMTALTKGTLCSGM